MCNNNGQDITFYQADCDVLSTIDKDWLAKDSSRFYNYKYRVTKGSSWFLIFIVN